MWKTQMAHLRQWLQGERGVRLVVLLGVAGLALILLSGLFSHETTSDSPQHTASESDDGETLAAYCTKLQTQLATLLGQIEGVGNCQVLVQASASEEQVYVQDAETDQDESRTQDRRSVVVLSDDGGEYALVEQVRAPEISGVVVVCQGAASATVQERISHAVQALLGLPANRICIVPSA